MIVRNIVVEETQFKLKLVCAGCKQEVVKWKCQLKSNSYAFCSLGCRNSNYSKVNKEWKPHNYKGPAKHTCQGCGCVFLVERCCPQDRTYCTRSCFAKHTARKPHSKATKIKLSKAAAEQCRRYGGKFPYLGVNGKINMRSSWEVKYALWLDSQRTKWEYEPTFKLSSGYTYIPDFKLNSGVIIEIKGYWWPDARIKWDMFCQEYSHIDKQLLMKDDLKKIGII